MWIKVEPSAYQCPKGCSTKAVTVEDTSGVKPLYRCGNCGSAWQYELHAHPRMVKP